MDTYRVQLNLVVYDIVLADSPAEAIKQAKAIARYNLTMDGYQIESEFAMSVSRTEPPYNCREEFAAVLGQGE